MKICFRPPGKEILPAIYALRLYTTINTSHHPQVFLSLSSKANRRARGIDQIITLSSHYVSYTTINTCSSTGLSFSLSSLNLIIVRGIDQITLRFQLLDFQSHAPLNFLLPPRLSLAFRQQLLVLRDAISG